MKQFVTRAATAWLIASGLFWIRPAHAQSGVDILSTGIAIHGKATFQTVHKEGGDSIVFSVGSGNGGGLPDVLIRLMSKHAMDKTKVSSALYARLARGGTATIRLADMAVLADGTPLRNDLLDATVMGLSVAEGRDSRAATFILRCVSANENLYPWAEAPGGTMVSEVDIWVTTPNGSDVDSFLLQHVANSKVVYVRVES